MTPELVTQIFEDFIRNNEFVITEGPPTAYFEYFLKSLWGDEISKQGRYVTYTSHGTAEEGTEPHLVNSPEEALSMLLTQLFRIGGEHNIVWRTKPRVTEQNGKFYAQCRLATIKHIPHYDIYMKVPLQ